MQYLDKAFLLLNRVFLILICFLTVSCDLMEYADGDCDGVSFGSAYVDECGRCVEGSTEYLDGHDKDLCGVCFGSGDCERCNDLTAINYIDIENTDYVSNDDICIYDLCTDFIDNLNSNNYS